MEHSTEAYHAFCAILDWNPSWTATISSTTVIGISIPLAILLNTLLIVAVLKKKKLQNMCNILLASMAVSDLLIGAVAQPLFLTAGLYRLQDDYEKMCIFILAGFFAMYLQSASIYHLTFIAWERYIAVNKAFSYKFIVTPGRVKACITASWVLTALSIVPSALYVPDVVGKELRTIADACFFTIPVSICLLAIVYFNAMSWVKRKAKKTAFVTVQVARAIWERKIAKTSFVLTLCLLVSFAPTLVLLFVTSLTHFRDRDAYLWSVILIQLNSCASPILYFYRNPRFRNTVLQMLHIKKSQTNATAPRAGRKEKQANNENVNEEALQNDNGPEIRLIGKQQTAKPDLCGESMSGEMMEMKELQRPRRAWEHPKKFTKLINKVSCQGGVEGHSQMRETRKTHQDVQLPPEEVGEKEVSSLYQDTNGPETSKRCQVTVSKGELRISLPPVES